MNNITNRERELWRAHDPRVYYLLYMVREREPQSGTIGGALGAAARFLARTGVDAYRGIAGALRTRRTIAELTRLDDHLLCDIGIDRERIPMIAQGWFVASGEAPRRDIPAAPCPREYLREAANDSRPLVAAA